MILDWDFRVPICVPESFALTRSLGYILRTSGEKDEGQHVSFTVMWTLKGNTRVKSRYQKGRHSQADTWDTLLSLGRHSANASWLGNGLICRSYGVGKSLCSFHDNPPTLRHYLCVRIMSELPNDACDINKRRLHPTDIVANPDIAGIGVRQVSYIIPRTSQLVRDKLNIEHL